MQIFWTCWSCDSKLFCCIGVVLWLHILTKPMACIRNCLWNKAKKLLEHPWLESKSWGQTESLFVSWRSTMQVIKETPKHHETPKSARASCISSMKLSYTSVNTGASSKRSTRWDFDVFSSDPLVSMASLSWSDILECALKRVQIRDASRVFAMHGLMAILRSSRPLFEQLAFETWFKSI